MKKKITVIVAVILCLAFALCEYEIHARGQNPQDHSSREYGGGS